jgi:hypothetical protein
MNDNPFAFLSRLPDAEMSGVVDKAPGVKIDGAWAGQHALVNCLFGEKVPQTTYTIGITGRGTLQMGEQEFRDLLSSMLAVFESRSPGFAVKSGPTSPSAAGLPLMPDVLKGAQSEE